MAAVAAAPFFICGPVLAVESCEGKPFQTGEASWYKHGKTTADGKPYRPYEIAGVAHRTLPLGSTVKIKHVGTGAVAFARVNDRGPFVGNRIVDMSPKLLQDLKLNSDDGIFKVALILCN